MKMQMEIRFNKCGISNQPNVCIFDDPCLSKFGSLQWGMSAPRETIRRTFVQHLPVLLKKHNRAKQMSELLSAVISIADSSEFCSRGLIMSMREHS